MVTPTRLHFAYYKFLPDTQEPSRDTSDGSWVD